MRFPRFALYLAVALLARSAWAEEAVVKSKIDSIGMFKNGLGVVQRSVSVPGPGTYRIEDVPSPVHGTFWIQSAAKVSVTVSSREVEAAPRAGEVTDFQTALAGKQVTIFFREGNIAPATGKVVALSDAKGDHAWSRAYRRPEYANYESSGRVAPQGQFLVLETAKGRTYVDSAMIASVAAEGVGDKVKQKLPVLILNVEGEKTEATTISISYLARGIAWAPSYRVNLDDPKKLTIEQQAVIKNELEEFKDAELQLISGFPSVQFAHVTSPLSLDTTWSTFFAQLSQRISSANGMDNNGQQVSMNNRGNTETGVDMSAIPTGEGVDLHYQPIGKRSLGEGDALSLSVAKAQAEYERIVEWMIPDTRNPYGHYIEEYQRNQDPDKYEDAAWDAVRFKNPLPFPMTTAPAMISSNGKFNGQRQSFWVNAGEQTTLRVTKALSLRTRAVEQEDQTDGRDIIYVGGRAFRKVSVKGELTVNNHRKEDMTLVIRRQFSGDLGKADGEPKCVLREEGVYSVNKRNELTWTLTLKSGENKTLMYHYTVLVAN